MDTCSLGKANVSRSDPNYELSAANLAMLSYVSHDQFAASRGFVINSPLSKNCGGEVSPQMLLPSVCIFQTESHTVVEGGYRLFPPSDSSTSSKTAPFSNDRFCKTRIDRN